ncbi:MAG: chorismate-binding protein [Akkermansiaceae bacterium]|jgi:menaquinone-specific isochorismate synthase|nr:chorismate-binding protein [Akkermansiaceae bacterium]MDP4647200.1 chorismate-binding protein [Akkermansiaceae bacterium]MDP4720118.1 chorismate-binding protein [Akkermansiaceae bacterium]MDP4780923.1 chorismate-binding protein [Akkermansiaceae bacterium]MDP4845746.1 chorismate-binding protein [Akkermansiaceae bacterium]
MSGRKAWLSRRDGTVVIGYGPFTPAEEAPVDGVAFYKRDFALSEEMPWQIPASYERMTVDEFRQKNGGAGSSDILWEIPDAMPFSFVFQEIMGCIRQGQIEKTVPVVTECGTVGGAVADMITAAMASQIAPLQSYGWVSEEDGFAGATPELLFKLDGLKLETMALAGTARQDDEAVFGVDEKEIREHEYVAQTLVAKLLDLGSLNRREREVLRLGSIVHFLTGISVELEAEQDPARLLRRLHPTPALGPLPRTDQTMALLNGWRKRMDCPKEFGAPFGVWDCGEFEAVVAIRGIWWNGQDVMLPAGCGIIEASRLVNEWRELRLKRDAVKRFLG